MLDANGDGMADVIGVSGDDERFLVWTSNGGGFNTAVEWYNGPFDYSAYVFFSD